MNKVVDSDLCTRFSGFPEVGSAIVHQLPIKLQDNKTVARLSGSKNS